MSDGNRSRQQSSTRRTALRTLAAAVTATPISMGVAHADSNSEKFHDEDDAPPLPYPNKTVYRYDESLYKITSQSYLLALSRDAIDRHFDTSGLEGQEFEHARDYVRNLRKRYPVERVEGDDEIVFQLSQEAQRNLNLDRRSGQPLVEGASDRGSRPSPSEGGVPSQQSDADRKALKLAVQAFSSTGTPTSISENDVTPMWNPNHHTTMLNDVSLSLGQTGSFHDWAAQPDKFASMANDRLGLKDGNLDITSPVPPVWAKTWSQAPSNQPTKA